MGTIDASISFFFLNSILWWNKNAVVLYILVQVLRRVCECWAIAMLTVERTVNQWPCEQGFFILIRINWIDTGITILPPMCVCFSLTLVHGRSRGYFSPCLSDRVQTNAISMWTVIFFSFLPGSTAGPFLCYDKSPSKKDWRVTKRKGGNGAIRVSWKKGHKWGSFT